MPYATPSPFEATLRSASQDEGYWGEAFRL